ncbi:ankyrin repeat domain-containing protein [Candidatus Dependentiae bacterium]|nr:ankyrin repeat domain-containing protein [Candidatus Dependentiae bacterium]
MKMLIDAGANVNHNQDNIFGKGIKTWTPLMLALKQGLIDIAAILLAAGANIEAENERDGNKTAYDYARENGYEDKLNEIIKGVPLQ